MKAPSLSLGTALLLLPALLATGLLVWGGLKVVPVYERKEDSRCLAEYREAAADLKDNPARGAGVVPERRGIRRMMKPGRWGYSEEGVKAVVWYSEGERVQSVVLPRVERLPVRTMTISAVSLALLFLWSLTLLGHWAFLQTLKMRDAFVAATAHDLKTPLVALRRLVGKDVAEEKALVERLLRLVANLTDFLRLGGSPVKNPLEKVDLVQAYDEAYHLFREDYRWTMGGDVKKEGLESLFVAADEQALVQILWNLLGNDLKYAAPFGPVAVRFSQDDAWAYASLEDSGKGLSARDRKKVFTRYYRAKNALKSGKGGFGVGLCTAREAARLMGGDLVVSPHAPTGCVFTLKLKRALDK